MEPIGHQIEFLQKYHKLFLDIEAESDNINENIGIDVMQMSDLNEMRDISQAIEVSLGLVRDHVQYNLIASLQTKNKD